MVRYLDQDYQQASKPTGLIPHFWDTIDSLGGILGLSLLFLGICAFYYIVMYTIVSGRQKREAAKKRR